MSKLKVVWTSQFKKDYKAGRAISTWICSTMSSEAWPTRKS